MSETSPRGEVDSPQGEDERVFLFMLPRNKELVDFAKNLRKNMTFEEKTLWYIFHSSLYASYILRYCFYYRSYFVKSNG